jgi:ribosomal protein S18 acetylase RimI-like enzyme
VVTIVHAGPDDADLVLRAADLFDHPPVPEHTATFLAAPGHHLLVALDGHEPVGFVSGVETIHPDKGTEMFVYELGIHEDHRRRGVATALLDELRRIAADRGCNGLWVATEPDNAPAIATYLRAGYRGPESAVMFERRFD